MAEPVQLLKSVGAVPLSEMRAEMRTWAKGLPLWARSGYRGVRAWAMVDADDYWLVSQERWMYSNGYVRRTEFLGDGTKQTRYLHRDLMGLGVGRLPSEEPRLVVDHINREPLDNRRCNLRVCTDRQNAQNREGRRGRYLPRGVTRTRGGRFLARAGTAGRFRLGVFATADEAAEVAAKFRADHMPHATD